MIEFLLFCIASVGMTSIITQGSIFHPFRQYIANWATETRNRWEQKAQPGDVSRRFFIEWFNDLINCAQGTGFWCGLFCGLLIIPLETCWIERFDMLPRLLLTWFCCGLGGSFLSALGCISIEWVFYHKMNALRKLEEQDIALAERRTNLPEEQK
jgi:hypothetical protein